VAIIEALQTLIGSHQLELIVQTYSVVQVLTLVVAVEVEQPVPFVVMQFLYLGYIL
jgi:hypothetical protein